MRFKATSEHTADRSVEHCCAKGIYSDPADGFDEIIEAASFDEANKKAWELLDAEVRGCATCSCSRRLRPGGEQWAASVVINLDPLDEEAKRSKAEAFGEEE